ncbi:hypothetical protein P4O66_002643 [Electrophorus voltai]|uniref:Receptor for retinol uptake STRA6 n=1 Tax=Electrophorus voltai TaxID=2609070 RepID=A0AAD8YWU7_9TELE|nr:hypothetical protein P4O66_002643 [Electrophorus voltai]
MVILALLARQQKLGGSLQGVSGLLSPVNFLDHTQHKGLSVAVFGVLFCKLVKLVMAPNPLPFIKDIQNREYWLILALFYYPALYYPLLACGTFHNKVGYVLGSLLSWTHFGVLVWQKVDCPKTPQIYIYYALLSSLPQIACLAFLSFQYPLLLFKGLKGTEKNNSSEDLESSYYRDYLKKILKKKKLSKASSSKPKMSEIISHTLKSYIYIPDEVFRFPLKIAISLVVEIIALYQIALLMVTGLVPTLQKARSGVDEDITFLLAGFNIILSQDRKEVVKIVVYYMWCIEEVALSCTIIQTLVFFICLVFAVFLVIIPIFYGKNLVLFHFIGRMWPFWLLLFLAVLIQHLMSRFWFIQKEAGTRDLANRGSLFLLTYLLFPTNVLVGVLLSIWRLVITALFNIIHLGRMDISLLNRSVEAFDPGYHCYAHYLKIEVSQSHPVMKAFCGLLLQSQRQDQSSGQEARDAEEEALPVYRVSSHSWLCSLYLMTTFYAFVLRSFLPPEGQ